ncbi:MAG: hypothetical protein J6D36_01840 [Erysipelotrichaceae bacterium]|nr:hypothetical protein [Erysipelotrichaceae bacterium]
MNYQTFKNNVIGKTFDIDRMFGNQCWDGAAKWWLDNGLPLFFCTVTGYVRDIWEQRGSSGILNYCDEVYTMQPGDVAVFQPQGETPDSHIAIFDSDAGYGYGWFLGQNQGGPNGAFNVIKLPYYLTYPTAFRIKGKTPTTGKIGYLAHVQDIGWQNPVYDGATAGTTGQSKRMEALKVYSTDGTIVQEIKVYIEKEGWKTFKNPSKDTVMGTTGKSLRMEAISLKMSKKCKFRVHIQDKDWTGWMDCDGKAIAGKEKSGKRIEAIQIKRV